MQEGWLKERQIRLSYTGCHVCGGENPHVCGCAREQWIKEQQAKAPAPAERKDDQKKRKTVSTEQYPDGFPFVFDGPPGEDAALEREWNERVSKSASLCAICPTCGGSSISTCPCAKKKWMDSKRMYQVIPKRPSDDTGKIFALGK